MAFLGVFAGSPRDFFWVLTFGFIQSSPSLEIPSTSLGVQEMDPSILTVLHLVHLCLRHPHSSINKYSQSIPLIEISINIPINNRSTLDQQSVDSRPSVDQLLWKGRKLVDSWPTVNRDVDGELIECQLRCRWSVNQILIEGGSRMDWLTPNRGYPLYTWSLHSHYC